MASHPANRQCPCAQAVHDDHAGWLITNLAKDVLSNQWSHFCEQQLYGPWMLATEINL